jgi:hypothetical protein
VMTTPELDDPAMDAAIERERERLGP